MPSADSSTIKYRTNRRKNIADFIGQRFGHLTILAEAERNPKYPKHQQAACVCACGKATTRMFAQILSGHIQSCGCAKDKTKHGHATDGESSRTYAIWDSMRQRCHNPKASNYHNYGGRGITVCPEWHDFRNFLADMGEPPTPAHTLDRKDNNGNYERSNCRWSTWSEQMRNTRQNRYLIFKEQRKCIAEWCEIFDIKRNTLLCRLRLGWDVERALTTPPHPKKRLL